MSDILAKTISQRARAQRNEQRNEQATRRTPPRGLPAGEGQVSDQTAQQRATPVASARPTATRPTTSGTPAARGLTRGTTNGGATSSRTAGSAPPTPARPTAPLAARPLRAIPTATRQAMPSRVLQRPAATMDQQPAQKTSQQPEQAQPAPRTPLRLTADARERPELPLSADADTVDMADRVLEMPPRRTAATRARTVSPLAATDAMPTTESARPATAARPDQTQSPRAVNALPDGMASLREVASEYEARLARVAGKPTGRSTRQPAPTNASVASDERDEGSEEHTPALSPAERLDVSAPDVCPVCHGAGYVRIDVPLGDPSFGQAVPCNCKERLWEERRRSELNQLSSLAPFRNKTFETFDARVPGLAEGFEVARRYAESGEGWLVLAGGYGTGKTHLAAAIANEKLSHGTPVFFSVVPDLLDHLRAAFAPNSEITYDTLFDRIREVELLVLDDLGAENSTAWATEKLFQLLNYRYNQRMPTVFTTNRKLLDHLDERIRSRLSDLSLVRHVMIEAADFRERHAGRPQRGSRTTGGNSGNTGNSGRGGSGGNLPPRGRGYYR